MAFAMFLHNNLLMLTPQRSQFRRSQFDYEGERSAGNGRRAIAGRHFQRLVKSRALDPHLAARRFHQGAARGHIPDH